MGQPLSVSADIAKQRRPSVALPRTPQSVEPLYRSDAVLVGKDAVFVERTGDINPGVVMPISRSPYNCVYLDIRAVSESETIRVSLHGSWSETDRGPAETSTTGADYGLIRA